MVADGMVSPFLRLNNIPLICMYNTLFMHLFNGHMCCFHILATVNNHMTNMGIQMFILYPVSISFGYIPRSGITGSCGSFNFLKKLQTLP